MALYTVANGQVINASDVNQLVNMMQAPSGAQEKAKYWLGGNGYATNAVISYYVRTTSQGATPVSVSIDTTDQAPTGSLFSPNAVHLTAYGFQIYANTSAATGNAYCAGGYTVQY